MKNLFILFISFSFFSCDFLLKEDINPSSNIEINDNELLNNKSDSISSLILEINLLNEKIKRLEKNQRDETNSKIINLVNNESSVANNDLFVLYGGGWENNIFVSASGYKSESFKVTGTNCNISGPDSKGIYTAKVPDVRKKVAIIRVSAVDNNGKTVELAKKEFRLFGLPDPQAFFGGCKRGTIKKIDAMSTPLLIAKLENNPLDCPFTVVSYKVKCNATDPPWDLPSNGRRMTSAIQKKIGKTPKGLDIKFHKIKVVGPPGGNVKEIQPIVLTLN